MCPKHVSKIIYKIAKGLKINKIVFKLIINTVNVYTESIKKSNLKAMLYLTTQLKKYYFRMNMLMIF